VFPQASCCGFWIVKSDSHSSLDGVETARAHGEFASWITNPEFPSLEHQPGLDVTPFLKNKKQHFFQFRLMTKTTLIM